jgi:hypothetical protein
MERVDDTRRLRRASLSYVKRRWRNLTFPQLLPNTVRLQELGG